jgi:hypothetical protein
MMAPEDAARLRLVNGDAIVLRNPFGEFQGKVSCSAGGIHRIFKPMNKSERELAEKIGITTKGGSVTKGGLPSPVSVPFVTR